MNPYIYLLKIAWKYAEKERTKYILLYLAFFCSNVVFSLGPLLWGWFVEVIQKPEADIIKEGWIYVAGYMAIRLGDWAFHGPARIVEREMAFNISRNMTHELYHKTLHLPVQWHQDHHSGATINRIKKASTAIKNFFQSGFEYLHALSKFLFSFIAMIYFSPLFGGTGLLLGVLIVYIIAKFDKPYIATLDQVNEKEHDVTSNLFDSLSNVITVITLRLEKRMEKGLLHKIGLMLPPFKRNVRINEYKWFVVDLLVGVIYCVVLLGYLYQNYEPGKVFLLGGLVTLIGFVERFTSVFHNVAFLYSGVVQHSTDVKAAQGILNAYDQEKIPEQKAEENLKWDVVEIRNLNFRPKNKNEDNGSVGLKNLDIKIQKGKKVAVIGSSGSGKSSLLAVLRGLFKPEEGYEVIVDGKPLKSDLNFLKNGVTLFPQEPEIFENTIEYNITLGLETDAKAIALACNQAQFKEVIDQLPHGLQSNIVEKGVNLSGGQKQRLALARGIFAADDAELVLLDEPTSSIDPKTEGLIYGALFEKFKDIAIISTLHRLHLTAQFDEIWIMENGEIIEKGHFKSLIENSEVFKEMWSHQEVKE